MALAHLEQHPEEAARILERFAPDNMAAVLNEAPAAATAAVLACLAPAFASTCLGELRPDARLRVMEVLPVPAAAAALRLLPAAVQEEVVGTISEVFRKPLERALRRPPDSAAALADPLVPTLHVDLSVAEAAGRLRQDGGEVPSRIFVLNRSQRVVGTATPAMLLAAAGDAEVGSLPLERAPLLAAWTNVPAVLQADGLGAGAHAVVDATGTFLGVLAAKAVPHALQRKVPRSMTETLASLSELYWLGMREVFGGLSAGARMAERAERR